MQVTKCDKCKKETTQKDPYLSLRGFKMIPDKMWGIQLCEKCAKPYTDQLLKDKLEENK